MSPLKLHCVHPFIHQTLRGVQRNYQILQEFPQTPEEYKRKVETSRLSSTKLF